MKWLLKRSTNAKQPEKLLYSYPFKCQLSDEMDRVEDKSPDKVKKNESNSKRL